MGHSPEDGASGDFQIGQMVSLRADPRVVGAVVAVLPGDPEYRYTVFHDGRARVYYTSQLQPAAVAEAPQELVSLPEFTAYLTAVEVGQPASSTLHSRNSARIDFIPYQFRPVLRFIRSDRPRMLLADGVGVGKTIEAGLILRELQARQDVQSVLIVCPRPLVTERKWEIEMRRFGERFVHLDGQALRLCLRELDIGGEWPQEYRKAILPYSLFDEALLFGSGNHPGLRGRGLLAADPPPHFDLLIVDEAHHIKNPETHAHRAVRYLCDQAEAVLFLTATPIQLGSGDLFTLLNCIRPDIIIDQPSFEHMAEPNPLINRAVQCARSQSPTWHLDALSALAAAAQTPWGSAVLAKDPRLQAVTERLRQQPASAEERVALVNDIEQLHTFSGMLSRTRRRDIGDFTVRKPETIRIEFTPEQRGLHDALLAVQARIMSELHGDSSVPFLMTTIRRQAASCLPALAPLLREILTRRLDELTLEEADDSFEGLSDRAVDAIERAIDAVLALAEALPADDPKLDALMRVIAQKRRLPNRRLMLFSSFRHTLGYLYQQLHSAGYRVAQVHGGTPDDERVRYRERFELSPEDPSAIDILLFSEIGCEGLDYQFCDCMVNYDLPWNPMRIEQRIGRIDRNGQRSESIAIYNLIVENTVDADIYDRCLVRIGIFNEALGASEEILGEITQQIRSVAESLQLTPEERQLKLQQIADNQIRRLHEERRLEEQQAELLGLTVPTSTAHREVEEACSRWLSAVAVEAMVKYYLSRTCGEGSYILGEGEVRTLRLSQDSRNSLLDDFRKTMRGATGLEHRLWENWLKGAEPTMRITFDSAVASDQPNVALISALHPLVRQAATQLQLKHPLITAFEYAGPDAAAGLYTFAVYRWEYRGMRGGQSLLAVTDCPVSSDRFMHLVAEGRDVPPDRGSPPPQSALDDLDAQHYRLWSEARRKHQGQTALLSQYRRESLQTSHQGRVAALKDQLSQAHNERIRRMRLAQLTAAENDLRRQLAELEAAADRADIMAEPIAFGTMHILQGARDGDGLREDSS